MTSIPQTAQRRDEINGAYRREAISARNSLRVSQPRLKRFLALPPGERIARALQWQINLGEMLAWAARYPSEPPLIDGEWFFITQDLADDEEYFHPTDSTGELR